MLDVFVAESAAPAWVMEFTQQLWQAEKAPPLNPETKLVLLTWQGPWGVVLTSEVSPSADVATVTQFCLQNKQLQETWNSVHDLVQMISRDGFCSV